MHPCIHVTSHASVRPAIDPSFISDPGLSGKDELMGLGSARKHSLWDHQVIAAVEAWVVQW